MDLLFQRYANPFLLLDGYIQTGEFEAFVIHFVEAHNKELEEKYNWEFFLHKVFDKSFSEFIEEEKVNRENLEMSDSDKEAAVMHTYEILSNFNPTRGEAD